MSNEKEKPIGALWLKDGANGQFFSGQLENADGVKVSIVVFPNSYKTEEKHPDFKIFRARDQGAASREVPPQPAPPAQHAPPPHTDADEPAPKDDIPF